MQQNEFETAFADIIERATRMRPAGLGAAKRLRDDLNLDSLAMIEIAVATEDAFGVPIPDDDLERFVTVGDVLHYIQRAKAEAPV